jgi:integration host factor subunit beta
MTTTKHDISQQLSERLSLDPKEANRAVESILATISDALVEGDYWELRNFGVFKLKQRAPRLGRNIHTGDNIPVPSYRDVVFKPGKEMLLRVADAPKIVRPKLRKQPASQDADA